MNEVVKNAIDFAFVNKVAEMGSEVETALFQKVSDAIMGKREEIARSLLYPEVQEESVNEGGGFDDLLDIAKKINPNAKKGDSVAKQKADRDELFAKRKEAAEKDKKEHPEKYKWQKPIDSYPLGGRDEKSGRSYSESFDNYSDEELDEMIAEALAADQGAGAWIKDFMDSGKTREQALAAYYQAKRNKTKSEMANAMKKTRNK